MAQGASQVLFSAFPWVVRHVKCTTLCIRMYAQHYRSWMKRQQTKLPTNNRPVRSVRPPTHPTLSFLYIGSSCIFQPSILALGCE